MFLFFSIEILLLSGTSMSGGLAPLCNRTSTLPALEVSSADCFGETPEMECPCCTICCGDGTTADNMGAQACTSSVYFGAIDPNWKDSFERTEYKFGISN